MSDTQAATSRSGEVVVNDLGAVPPAKSGAPPQLVTFARGLLRTTRSSVRFLWSDDQGWLAVNIERQRRHDLHRDQAVLTYAPVQLPGGVTDREINILTLLALGLTNVQIAGRLGTSARTVSTQIERMLVKLGQPSRGGLAALAVDAGLIQLPIPGGADGLSSIGPVEVELATTQKDDVARAPGHAVSVTFPSLRPFRLGTLLGVCGSSTADADEMRRGSTLAVEEINLRGGVAGRSIEHVISRVDIFDPADVERGTLELIDQDVDSITTSYVSAQNPFVLDLVSDHQIPFLHTATWEDQVRQVEANPGRYGMVFQTCPSETHYGHGLLRLLADLEDHGHWRPRDRTILAIELDTNGAHTTNDVFLAAAARMHWTVSDVVTVPIGEVDWSEILRRIEQTQPDVIMVNHFVPDVLVSLQRVIAQARVQALTYYVYGASMPHFRDALGADADGVIWSTVTGLYEDPLGRDFRARYLKRFGTDAGWSQASASYDQVQILAGAWSATATRDRREVASYLRRTAHRGLNGVYFMGNEGQSALSYPDVTPDASIGQAHLVFQIQQGESRILSPFPNGTVELFRRPGWFDALTG
jgi:branched-chain amino acid transport system substrate-binding protein